MFDFLKKKISSWIKPSEEKTKKDKKSSKSTKKIDKKPKKEKKESKKTKKNETQTETVSIQTTQETKIEKVTESEGVSVESEGVSVESEGVSVESEGVSVEPKTISTESVEKIQEIEEPKEEKQGFFSKIFSKITTSKLSKEDFQEAFQDLEITLLENNVALEAVDKIKASLETQLVNQQIKKTDAQKKILESLKTAILDLLIEPPNLIEQIKESKEPYVILFFGINGTGKTTSIAKLSYLLNKNKISSVMAAADTFRAASIEQLKTHGQRLGIHVVSQEYNSDPAAVAFDAIAYAKKHSIKVVLVDTAGRMYTKGNLLKEMEKIVRVSKPNLKLFVGESITGNDAIDQAKTFNDAIGIDGIILSKADIDEKAGTILSVSYVTKRPIYFLGTGQTYEDLTPFTKKTVLKNLGLD